MDPFTFLLISAQFCSGQVVCNPSHFFSFWRGKIKPQTQYCFQIIFISLRRLQRQSFDVCDGCRLKNSPARDFKLSLHLRACWTSLRATGLFLANPFDRSSSHANPVYPAVRALPFPLRGTHFCQPFPAPSANESGKIEREIKWNKYTVSKSTVLNCKGWCPAARYLR